MKKKMLLAMFCVAVMALTGNALAQPKMPPVAGATTEAIGVSTDELVVVTKGWSVKKKIMGKEVYNDKNEKVGTVDDLIVSPDKAVSFAIIGAGGFLGIKKHDVAVRVNQFKMQDGKIILPGATKDIIKAMPAFEYAP